VAGAAGGKSGVSAVRDRSAVEGLARLSDPVHVEASAQHGGNVDLQRRNHVDEYPVDIARRHERGSLADRNERVGDRRDLGAKSGVPHRGAQIQSCNQDPGGREQRERVGVELGLCNPPRAGGLASAGGDGGAQDGDGGEGGQPCGREDHEGRPGYGAG
jgi:hypothetical protein